MNPSQELRALLSTHGLSAKKRFGQNFLISEGALAAIVASAVEDKPEALIEIGPGPGTLTRRLLAASPAPLTAIEADRDFAQLLPEALGAPARLRVLAQDVLSVELGALYPELRPAVVGNLPYNISTPILLQLIAARHALGPATLMLQREVAARLLAGPGSKTYGSLSVLLQLHAKLSRVRSVPPGAFFPAPKVHSTVIKLRWLQAPAVPVGDPEHFQRVVRAGFSQRRKRLSNALKTQFSPAQLVAAAEAIDLSRRAETLSLEEFSVLAAAIPAGDLERQRREDDDPEDQRRGDPRHRSRHIQGRRLGRRERQGCGAFRVGS